MITILAQPRFGGDLTLEVISFRPATVLYSYRRAKSSNLFSAQFGHVILGYACLACYIWLSIGMGLCLFYCMPFWALVRGSPASLRTRLVLRLIECFRHRLSSSSQFLIILACNAAERWILHTATSISQARNRAIVGPACKLLLHRLREYRSFNVRIRGRLLREFSVKVRSVKRIRLPRLVSLAETNKSNGVLTTFGLNDGSYLRCSNFLQSIALKNGCALISDGPLAPSLCSGLRSRSCIKRSFAGSGTISGPGKWRGSDKIFRYISLVFSS